MAIEFLLDGLKRRLGGSLAARIVSVLRQDETVWEALKSDDLSARALEVCGVQPERWTPGMIALVALDQADLIDTIALEPMKALDSGLRTRAVREYENSRKKGIAPTGLAEAGLLGLALRERRRLTGNWNGLAAELLTAPSGSRNISGKNWRTALACLACFVPNFNELGQALIGRDAGSNGLEWLAHIFATQFGDAGDLGERIAQALQGLSFSKQLDVLKALRQRGLQPAVEKAANLLISSQPQLVAGVDAGSGEDGLVSQLAEQAVLAQQLATFHQLAGNPALADKALQTARGTLSAMQTGLDMQGGKLSSNANWIGELVDVLPLSGSAGKAMMKQVGLAIHSQSDEPFGAGGRAYAKSDPFLSIEEAERQKRLGNLQVAAEIARGAAEELVDAINKARLFLGGDFRFEVDFGRVVRSLLNLSQAKSAARVAEAAMKLTPAQAELAGLASQAFAQSGDPSRAREYAAVAVYAAPDDLDQVRNLAKICEICGDWPSAFARRKEILESSETAEENDQVDFARAALNAGEVEEAVETCARVVAANPDQGDAHGILGLARAAQGKSDDAVLHLQRATLAAADKDEWWLALADLHRESGDDRSSLETLRAAALAVPESAEIQYHLGEMYLSEGLNTEALPHLRQAAALRPENPAVTFRLAKALHALGYHGDARKVIDSLPAQSLAEPEVAHEYAGIALALEDGDAAIDAYENAIRGAKDNPERIDWLREYAQALLNRRLHARKLDEAQRSERAESLLREVIELNPDDVETGLLLADSLRKQGNFQGAYELYQGLVDRPEVAEHDLLGAVQHGFGLTAIGLDQVETGIAMLQEASESLPNNVEVVKDLAEACLAARLDQDAVLYAERALEKAIDDHVTLNWFSGIMQRLGKPERAAEALHAAMERFPEQGDLRVKFAELALQAGAVDDARDALDELPDLDLIDPDLLRQAAYLHLRMQEPKQAIEMLERAVLVSAEPDPILLFDLAKVLEENGRTEDALITLQKAPEEKQPAAMLAFNADLLASQKRYQAAVLSIDRALKHAQGKEAAATSAGQLAGMFARAAIWLRELGNVSSAFEHIEKAVALEPDDLGMRFTAANLASALLADEKALKYVLTPFEIDSRQDMAGIGAQLAGLSGHLALQAGRVDEAQSLYDACKGIDALDPWMQSLAARLAARGGDLLKAAEIARQIIARVENDGAGSDLLLWIARTAFESYLWPESFRLFGHLVTNHPAEPRHSFELAKAMIEAGETQSLCKELGVQAHAPEVNGELQAVQDRIGELLQSVQTYLSQAEFARWMTRVRWLQRNSGLELEDLIEEATAADAAAKMIALRGAKNLDGAVRSAGQFADEPEVVVQTALSLADDDTDTAMEKAANLVSRAPNHPIHQALYARLAQKGGYDVEALQALENAIDCWPEEAQWHAWAGELAQRLGEGEKSLEHWKRALLQQPGNLDYAVEASLALGQQGDYVSAIELLSKRVEEEPNNARLWLALANAQRGAGNTDAALRAALKASQQKGAQLDGLIAAAQICQESGQADQALQYAQAAHKLAPKNADTIVNLSRVLTAQGKAVESLDLISHSIETLEPSTTLLFERARLVHQLQGAEAAEGLVNELVEENPDAPEVLALHANVQADLGQLKTAERSAFRSLRLQPHQPELALALARMNRKAGQLDQAVHLLGQASAMDASNAEIYLELGQTYLDRREDQNALKAFEKAIEAAPRDARAYYQSALLLKDTKDYAGAEAMLQKAAQCAPDDLPIHRQLVSVMALNLIHKSQEASKA